MQRDFALAGVWPARPRPIGSMAPIQTDDVVVVTSVVRPGRATLAYGRSRSAFGADERFDQTLRTIDSVRTHAPAATLVFVEGSAIDDARWARLTAGVDRALRLDHDRRAVRLRDSLSKAAGEAYLLLGVQSLLRASAYQRVFKLSGRYELTHGFHPDAFGRDRIALRRLGVHRRFGISYSTRLYSVPASMRDVWERQLRRALRAGFRTMPMEYSIARGLTPDQFVEIDRLGVRGRWAVSGTPIEE